MIATERVMEWIASRTLRDASGNEVLISLGLPYSVGPDEWVCRFEILGHTPAEVMEAHGYDAFQALLLAIAALQRAVRADPRQLTWLAEVPCDSGIPRWPSLALEPHARLQIEALVEKEEELWCTSRLAGAVGAGPG
jgi:hypothetical protein